MSEGARESPESALENGGADSQRVLPSEEDAVMPVEGDTKLDEAWDLPLNIVNAATKWRRKTVAGSTAVLGRLRRRQQGRVGNPRIRPAEAVYRDGQSGAGDDDDDDGRAPPPPVQAEVAEHAVLLREGKPGGTGTGADDRRNRFMKRKSSVLFDKMGDMPPTLPGGHYRSAGPLPPARQGLQATPAPAKPVADADAASDATTASPADDQARADRAAQVVSLRVLCEQWLTLILTQEDLRSGASVVRAGRAQAYAVEHLIPTVTVCLARTLRRAERRGVLRAPCDADTADADAAHAAHAAHGALVGLAEEMMRHNPRYSVGEVSVYARAMRGTLVEIKSMGEELTTERLAAARTAAQRKMNMAEEAAETETARRKAETVEAARKETEAVKEKEMAETARKESEAAKEKEMQEAVKLEKMEKEETDAVKEAEPADVEEKPSEPGSLELARTAVGAALILGWAVGVEDEQTLVITRNHILRFFEDNMDDEQLKGLFAKTAANEEDTMFAKYQSVLQDADNDVVLESPVAMSIVLPFVVNCNKDFLSTFSRRLEKHGKAVQELEVEAKIRAKISSTFSALQAQSTGLVNRHKVLTLMEDFYTYLGSDVKKHLTCPSRFPVVDILESTDTGQETGGVLLETIPEGHESQPSLLEMMKQGRPASRLMYAQQGVAASSKKVLARARLESRRSVASRYGATENLAELRASGEPSPQPLPMSPIDSQSPLNELTLGADQFAVMIENFLGEALKSDVLENLLRHFEDEYKETEAEIALLAKMAQQNARHAYETESIDKLFDRLDHEHQRGFVEYGQLSETLNHWALAQPSITEDDINNFLDLEDNSVATLNRVEFQQLVRFLGAGYEKGLDSVLETLGEAIKLTNTQQELVLDQRKWLRRVLAVGSCCIFDPEPAFKAAFNVIQENNERIEDGKRVSVAASLFDKSEAKKRHLQFVAATSEDSYLVGKQVPKQYQSAMYKAAKTGETVYVANIQMGESGVRVFNPEREERETCAFMAVPIPHAKTGQALGVLSMDTMGEKGDTAETEEPRPFAALEMRFAERIAHALGHILCDIEARKMTVIAVQEAMRWACRCLSNVKTSAVYTMETLIDTKQDVVVGYAFRKAIAFLGVTPLVDTAAPRIERKKASNAHKSYLFRCMDTSLPVSSAVVPGAATAHVAFPLRDGRGVATAVLDIEMDRPYHSLGPAERDRLASLLRQLTVARFHASDSDSAQGLARRAARPPAPDLQFLDDDIDASSAFMSVMLDDVNNALLSLTDNDLKEVKSYNAPPHGVDTVMCIVLSLLALDSKENKVFSTWDDCKQAMHDLDLMQKMVDFKPLDAAVSKEQVDKLDDLLLAVVIKASDVAAPLAWIHEWCVACLSLINCKLRVTATLQSLQGSDNEMQLMAKPSPLVGTA